MTTNAVVRNALERAGQTVAKNGLSTKDAKAQLQKCSAVAKKDIAKLLLSAMDRIDKYTDEMSAIGNKVDWKLDEKGYDEVQDRIGALTGPAVEALRSIAEANRSLGIR